MAIYPDDWNITAIDKYMDYKDFWRPEFDNETLEMVIGAIIPQELAYETFSFYILFFGEYGIMNEMK